MIANASEQIQAGGMGWLLPQRKKCLYIWNKLLKTSITALKYHRGELTSKFYLIQFRSSWFNSIAARTEAANEACQAFILLQGNSRLHSSTSLRKKKPSPPSKPIGVFMRRVNWFIFHQNKVFWEQRKQLGKVCFPDLQATDTSRKTQLPWSSPLIGARFLICFPLTQE